MPIVFGAAVRHTNGPRCVRCGRSTSVAFAQRPPCECGSKAWISGPAMSWPPYVLNTPPCFLLGTLPVGRFRPLEVEPAAPHLGAE